MKRFLAVLSLTLVPLSLASLAQAKDPYRYCYRVCVRHCVDRMTEITGKDALGLPVTSYVIRQICEDICNDVCDTLYP